MYDRATILHLVALSYEAAVDPDRWRHLLDHLAEVIGGHAVNLGYIDTKAPPLSVGVSARWDPDAYRDYQVYFSQRDPWAVAGTEKGLLRPGAVGLGEELVSKGDFERTEFYSDYGRRYGLVGGVTGVMSHDAASVATISAFSLPNRTFAVAEVELITTLLPHLQRSLQLHRRLAGAELLATDVARVLDRMPHAVLLLSARGRVTYMNRVAERLTGMRDGLVVENQELRAARGADTSRLRRVLADAVATSVGDGLRAGGLLALGRPSGRRPLMVLVSPLPTRRTLMEEIEPPAAIVIVTDPEHAEIADEGTLRALLGLTNAEATLARLLAQGVTLDDAAVRLGLRTATLRTRLKAIFEKTNTHRQTDLMRLVLLLPRP